MHVRVTVRGIDKGAELRGQVEERVAATLNRFEDRIRAVAVLLEDVTGPHKQVVDKRCRVDVRLKRGGELTIDGLGKDIRATLAVALDRLKAVIGRKVSRTKRGVGAG